MKASVVVPIYNTAEYLPRCLDSLAKQSLDSFEVILVDNNSTDDSPKIIKEYCKNFPDIFTSLKVKKSGASAARNAGIRVATGEYLVFVDSDDYVSLDMLEKIVTTAKKSAADVVAVGANLHKKDGGIEYFGLYRQGGTLKKRFLLSGFGPVGVATRRKFFIENNLFFHEGIIYEDLAIIGTYILHTDKIAVIKEPVYQIVERTNSIMRGTKWKKEIGESIFVALDDLYGAFDKVGAVKEYHAELEQIFATALLKNIAGYMLPFKQATPYYEKMRTVMKEKFPRWWKNKYIKK
ncbi:glycosyltransferase family 2 protein, partial [Candidatus Saccharibacteria bacterium]|nr:glycosyltransferase family 2 protein [Candidatus Saccharibacteria bacterium]